MTQPAMRAPAIPVRFVLTALIATLCAVGLSASPRDTFDEAERRFSSGNFTLAIERYEHLLNTWPGSQFTAQAQFRIAQSHFYLQNYPAALDRLQRTAARTAAGEAAQRIRFWIGLTQYQLQRHEDVVETMTRYLNLPAEQRGRALLYRGLSLLELGDTTGAADDLRAAMDQLEGSERGYAAAVLMEVYTRLHDDAAILRLWEENRTRLGRDDGFHEQRLRFAADAAYRLGREGVATELYEELTGYSLNNAQWALQQLSKMAQNAGDRAAVQEIFRRAERRLAAEPQRMRDFWFALGSDALEARRYELAELNFYRIWELRGELQVQGVVPLLLAQSVERQGRREEALQMLVESLNNPLVDDDHRRERIIAASRIHLAGGNYREAVQLLDSLPRDDTAVELLYGRAFALYRAGRNAEALSLLDQERLQPVLREEPELLRLRGRLLLAAGRPADAVRAFRSFLQEQPEAPPSMRLELIRALVAAEQFAAAAQESERIPAGELLPGERDDLAYLRGLTAFHNGDWSSVQQLLGGLTDQRYEPLRSYHLAWALYRSGAADDARDTIAAVVEQLPGELAFDGGYLFSWTLFQTRRLDDAERQLLRLMGRTERREQEIEARQLLAAVYLEQRTIEDALVQYRLLLALAANDEERARFWGQYASILAAIGRTTEAVEQYDALHEALPGTPGGAAALLEAGQILFTESRFSEARERFRQYRNRYPGSADLDRALYWAGAASLEMEEAGRALLWWEPLIQQFSRSPFAPQAMIETAMVYESRGQRRQALELFDRFVAAYPESTRIGEAETARRRIRLEIDGLSTREAALWVELEAIGSLPPSGGQRDRWYELVLQLGRISIREQISLTGQGLRRGLIVDYLLEGAAANHPGAAEAALLLAEYYRRRGENRAAIEQYLRVAAIAGAPEDLAAQGLYELAVLARQEGELPVMRSAIGELLERFPESVWADRAVRMVEQTQ